MGSNYLSMSTCSHCGKQEMMPFKCKFCGKSHCGDHRLPENHSCIGLRQFKETREKVPDTWVYEPFREDRKKAPVGRVITKSHLDRIKDYFMNLNSQKILNIILGFIALSLLISVLKG